jgi:HNH endonuclease/NUMOD4 motif/CENP-B N-terminal DNA-binding domain
VTMLDDSIETWRAIERTHGLYSVSSWGRVRRDLTTKGARAGRILKPIQMAIGYQKVAFYPEGHHVGMYIHRLVAETFLGPPPTPQHTQINHKDGVKTNNHVFNLEWQTPSGNNRHADATGLRVRPRGMALPGAKLSEDDVLFIRRKDHGLSLRALARRFGVGQTTVYYVLNRKTWAHIPESGGFP